MNDNLTDQQQAEIVKKWLKDNGLVHCCVIRHSNIWCVWIGVL